MAPTDWNICSGVINYPFCPIQCLLDMASVLDSKIPKKPIIFYFYSFVSFCSSYHLVLHPQCFQLCIKLKYQHSFFHYLFRYFFYMFLQLFNIRFSEINQSSPRSITTAVMMLPTNIPRTNIIMINILFTWYGPLNTSLNVFISTCLHIYIIADMKPTKNATKLNTPITQDIITTILRGIDNIANVIILCYLIPLDIKSIDCMCSKFEYCLFNNSLINKSCYFLYAVQFN